MHGAPRTREVWLVNAMETLRSEFFDAKGLSLPDKIQISCSWPYGTRQAIAQCAHPEDTEDGTAHIFISPTQDDSVKILSMIIHELGHLHLDKGVGHKAPFAQLMKKLGMGGKPKSAMAEEGSPLQTRLIAIAENIGTYPHDKIVLKPEENKTNKWVRVVSPREPAYKVVISPKTITQFGMPKDPWGNDMKLYQKEENE